jgi:isopentenyldiphosphate isomerase
VADLKRFDPAHERVEVLDADNNMIGVVTRAEMRAKKLRHRCVAIVVRGSNGDVLIHRRAEHKDLWPGRWDLAVGGVVGAGEGWEAAARRELREEIGVTAALRFLGRGSYQDADVNEYSWVYECTHDGPFAFDDGEVVEALFVPLDELRARSSAYPFVPDNVALVLPLIG